MAIMTEKTDRIEPEKKRGEKNRTPEIEEIPEEEPEIGDRSSWSRDQKEKSYYYDDSYGYEVYDPDEEE